MQIVHIAESVFGGVGSYLDEIGLHQSNVYGQNNVRFVIPSGSMQMLPSIARAQIVELPPLPRSSLGLVRLGAAIARIVHELDPDIVHMHSTFAGFAGRIALSVRPHRARIVYCPHGWAFGMEVGRLRRAAYALCERVLAARADTIIVNSESERVLALRYGFPRGRLQVVMNGVASAAPQGAASGRAPIRLAFIGRYDRQKGLDILLDEMDRPDCRHIDLHVVGKNVASRQSPLTGRALRNVTFHGWMSRDEIVSLLASVDAVVMPSRWEASPLVAIEAMRAGVPVIASDRGGLPEIVRHGVEGLIVDIEVAGMLGNVLAGLDTERLRSMGQAAKARFHAVFTAERMNREITAAYASLLAAPDRPRHPDLTEPAPTEM